MASKIYNNSDSSDFGHRGVVSVWKESADCDSGVKIYLWAFLTPQICIFDKMADIWRFPYIFQYCGMSGVISGYNRDWELNFEVEMSFRPHMGKLWGLCEPINPIEVSVKVALSEKDDKDIGSIRNEGAHHDSAVETYLRPFLTPQICIVYKMADILRFCYIF